jgi:uncharacterized RDD family membrane protein YckC
VLATAVAVFLLRADEPVAGVPAPPAIPATSITPAKPLAPEAPSQPVDPDGTNTASSDPTTGDSEQSSGKADNQNADVRVGDSLTVKVGEVMKDAVVVGGNATVDGTVDGDLIVIFGAVTVSGKVNGDIVNVGGGVHLLNHAYVDGDVVGVLGGVDKDPGAEVTGEITPFRLGDFWGERTPGWIADTFHQCILKLRPLSFTVRWVWVATSVFLLGYCLLAVLFPGSVQASVDSLKFRGIAAFLLGVLTLPLAAFGSLLLAVTVVGIPVIPFLWAALIFAGLIGKAGLLQHLGQALFRAAGVQLPPLAGLVIGWLLVTVFYLVPVFGLFVWLIASTWAVGGALLAVFSRPKAATQPNSGYASPSTPRMSPTSPPSPSPVAPIVPVVPITPVTPVPPTSTPASPDAVPIASTGLEPSPVNPSLGATLAVETPPPSVGNSFIPPVPPSTPYDSHTNSGGGVDELSLPRVGLWPRLGATILDWMVVGLLINGPLFEIHWAWLRNLIALLYFAAFYVWKGATPMGMIFRLKVVRTDRRPMDWPCALVRALAAAIGAIAAGLGYFWCAWDPEKQTWHDKLAGTIVVRTSRVEPLV